MNVTDDNIFELRHWVKFYTNVYEIYRKTWIFIFSEHNSKISLLIKISWLINVNAKIHIKIKKLYIKNILKDETVRYIKEL